MAHAIHFLERIERLNLRQADRALGLYRDPQAVAFLLQRLHLPDGVERVALALGGGDKPPHVVLTRSGQFVTCLAAGMGLRDLHAVPFLEMERQLNQLGALRETLNGKVTRGAALEKLKNLFHKSDGISREEFSSLMTLRPLLGQDLLQFNATSWQELDTFRNRWRPHPRLRGSRIEAHTLSLYWRTLWASAHITTLLATDVPELERRFSEVNSEFPTALTLTWSLVRSGVMGLILRGWHSAALLGRTFLPVGRYMIDMGMLTENATLLTIGGLLAVRTRQAHLHDDATRLLDEAQRSLETKDAPGDAAEDHAELINDVIPNVMTPFGALDAHLDDDDEDYEDDEADDAGIAGGDPYINILKLMVQALRSPSETPASAHLLPNLRSELFKAFPRGVFDHPDDISDDTALAVALHLRGTFSTETPGPTITLGQLLPPVCRLSPEQLYLPEALLRYVAHPTNKVDIDAVRRHLEYTSPRAPVLAEPKVGRNDPCICGSAKKYKACCGK